MRTLLKVTIPVEAGNQAVTSGRVGEILQQTLATLQPEAFYGVPLDGKRTVLIIFDLTDPSQIVTISEPLFQGLNAQLEFYPAMNQEDLLKGLSQLG